MRRRSLISGAGASLLAWHLPTLPARGAEEERYFAFVEAHIHERCKHPRTVVLATGGAFGVFDYGHFHNAADCIGYSCGMFQFAAHETVPANGEPWWLKELPAWQARSDVALTYLTEASRALYENTVARSVGFDATYQVAMVALLANPTNWLEAIAFARAARRYTQNVTVFAVHPSHRSIPAWVSNELAKFSNGNFNVRAIHTPDHCDDGDGWCEACETLAQWLDVNYYLPEVFGKLDA